MSHILEEYAKNLGVLISKPIISEHYFPIPESKYITIYSEENIQSKNYKHFNLMLDLITPEIICLMFHESYGLQKHFANICVY